MSKFNILFQVSGSIAAYKSAYLVSRLVQNGFEVQCVATPSALEFIGSATLEGLTSRPVLTDQFLSGSMMSHISLMKWADLVILAPASANSINKMAGGIADNLVTSLFLAYNFDKPYLVAPAMNANMFMHPSTQASLARLKEWGVEILPTETGYLACGDYGSGKMLDPDKVYDHIIKALKLKRKELPVPKKVLITAGATREKIDEVRFISNLSTGRTASMLAGALFAGGHSVTYLHGKRARLPSPGCRLIEFESIADLKDKLFESLQQNEFDLVVHLAAVSDFTVEKVEYNKETFDPGTMPKIESGRGSLNIHLRPSEKLVDHIKSHSANKKIKLVAFKFTGDDDAATQAQKIEKLFRSADADFVVVNHLKDRKDDIQGNFLLIGKNGSEYPASDPGKLAELILEITNSDKP
ncbi:MAG TPA: bifunctional phosphopantothenoylcysteine decarboxylase/phosphopantothenate--cysteine ligase CoaBC [Bacteroidales bacterium]|nr:bifunctional phosphopantothenoylcysteine decarboxylase/phosphopantothenate--cysteine ligase CoaBC [Bacteroidales bacterium]